MGKTREGASAPKAKSEFAVWVACRVRTSSGWRTECLPLSVEAATAGEARMAAANVYEGWLRERVVSSYRVLCAIMKEDMHNGADEQGHGF